MKLDKILVTTDLSEQALRPFAPVADLARGTGAALTLLHVVEDVQVPPHGAPLAPPLSSPSLPEEVEAAKRALAGQLTALGEGLEIHHAVVSGTNVAETITDYASKHGMDLIAISTHGRTGFRRLMMGSIAEAVLRHATVPVLVFPQGRR